MVKAKKLQWVLYPSFLVVVAVTLLSVGTYTVITVKDLFMSQTEARLAANGKLAADLVGPMIGQPTDISPGHSIDDIAKKIGRNLSSRVTVITPSGVVIGDSDEPLLRLGNHVDRPEFIEAVKSGTGRSVRHSATQDKDLMYLTFAVREGGELKGVVRVARPLVEINSVLRDLMAKIALGGLIAVVLAAFAAWLASRRVARPVEDMALGVNRLINDDLSGRISPPSIEEFETLAAAMNTLAAGLKDRLSASTQQQKELETTLSGMSEAVLLINPDGKIRRINSAGEKMLRVEPGMAAGREVLDIIRSRSLHDFVVLPVTGTDPVEEDLTLEGDKVRFLHAFKTAIRDDDGRFTGTLVVLHDITRLKRLENIRQDFVANVSHELKTPITSIKGFVETLREDDSHDPEITKHFLDIIARHTDRLNSIIEDLLVLSRIEQAENTKQNPGEVGPGIIRERVLVRDMIESAVQVCDSKAATKNIVVSMTCDPEAVACVNQQLLEQAIVNLVDNAIKYCEPDGRVSVEAGVADGRLKIVVTDNGCGIPMEDQSRIFERFYRVDKGRSRAQGGTGLGLSIVRHVARIHDGKVRVTSVPGEGSSFVIDVPAEISGDERSGV
jgi:two-component system phosphate regulon sensor histidine kinase PhoR